VNVITSQEGVPAGALSNAVASRDRVWLLIVLALGLGVRIAWWLAFDHVIELNGIDYVRLAESMFAGEGYIAMFGGPHVLYPPLYPILIGIFTPLTGSPEIAGRVVSLLSGLVLIWALWSIAARVFGARAGLMAGALAAFHPLAIALTVSVHTEPVWLALMACAVWLTVLAIDEPTRKRAAGIGALTGLAYLARPEGLAFALLLTGLVAFSWLWRRGSFKRNAAFCAVAGVAFLVFAVPYMAFLSSEAGTFRWEGKSGVNNILSARMREGLSYGQAARGLDADGNPAGVYLFADQRRFLREDAAGTGPLLATLLAHPIDRAVAIAKRFAYAEFLGRPLFLFAAIGIVATAWWAAAFWEGGVLLAVLAVQGLLLVSLQFTWSRFLFPLLPMLIVWAAAGIDRSSDVVSRLAGRYRTGAYALLASLACIAVCAVAVSGTLAVSELAQARISEVRPAGVAIARDFAGLHTEARRPVVMGGQESIAFYADGIYAYLPNASQALALKYVHAQRPDYIALRSGDRHEAPYMETWLEHGVPDDCARLIWENRQLDEEYISVWRWQCPPSAAQGSPPRS
jgi:4-amino-4-deoxy-L-arabinose transferase-like glycosyltransferase